MKNDSISWYCQLAKTLAERENNKSKMNWFRIIPVLIVGVAVVLSASIAFLLGKHEAIFIFPFGVAILTALLNAKAW